MNENDRGRITAELDVWAEGCRAARAGLGPRDCPYPWRPGWHSPHLHRLRGLAGTHREIGSQADMAWRSRRAVRRGEWDAACTARPWSPLRGDGTAPVWVVRLMRAVFP